MKYVETSPYVDRKLFIFNTGSMVHQKKKETVTEMCVKIAN
jgi:hypothetical protein